MRRVFSKRCLSSAAAVDVVKASPDGVLAPPAAKQFEFVVVGAGAAGLGLANALAKKLRKMPFSKTKRVALIDPSDAHHYQRSWTIAGCGRAEHPVDSRPLNKKLVSKRAEHIQQAVESFAPRENALYTADGCRVGYDFLVVATGTQPDMGSVEGLSEALEAKNRPICSTATLDGVAYTRKCIEKFAKGTVVFTHPRDISACTTSTHSAMFLTEHWLRDKGVRGRSPVQLWNGLDELYPVKKYRDALEQSCAKAAIDVLNSRQLVAIDSDRNEATYVTGVAAADGNYQMQHVTEPFDLLHVTPQREAIAPLRYSELSDLSGMVEVCKYTLRSVRFDNVFALGDCATTGAIKTAAAANDQAKTVLNNMIAVWKGRELDLEWGERSWGYTANATLTSPDTLVLAESAFENEPLETTILNQGKESKLLCKLHERMFPRVYWKKAVQGKFFGPAKYRERMLADTPWKEYTTPDFYEKEGENSKKLVGTPRRE